MKAKLMGWTLAVTFLSIFAVVSSAMAQENSSNSQTTSGSASQSSKSTTTTTTSSSKSAEPAQTTVTKTTAVDPIWLVAGGVGLIAILAIAFIAMRGRSRDSVVTAVHERETVVKDGNR